MLLCTSTYYEVTSVYGTHLKNAKEKNIYKYSHMNIVRIYS